MKKMISNIPAVLRLLLAVVAFGVQVAILFFLITLAEQYALPVTLIFDLCALVLVLYLMRKYENPTYKIAWIVVIMTLPVFGSVLYLIWGRQYGKHETRGDLDQYLEYLPQDEAVSLELERQYPSAASVSRYLNSYGFPVCKNTDYTFYPSGEEFLAAMQTACERAEKFIFIEFFAIIEGQIWNALEKVLLKKAADGVEIRIMLDEMGSFFSRPPQLVKRLRQAGIEVHIFNPILYQFSRAYFNYRNHQKIVVVDGNTAFTGGVNIGDEYANLYPKHGHWKDTAIELRGEAAWPMTVVFLQMWNSREQGIEKYRPTLFEDKPGYYQFFADGPMNNPENPAEEVYRQMMYSARKYIWITSPYLIIDSIMSDALRMAARRGVDVRLYLPHIPDHWYSHAVSHSNYARLLDGGVRIFEYLPGFVHAKMLAADDEMAVVGSINMDFRSFFLHYECAMWMCGSPAVETVKQDIILLEEKCVEINLDEWKKRPLAVRALQAGMNLFSPMM